MFTRAVAAVTVLALFFASCASDEVTSPRGEPLDELRILHPETLAFSAPFTMLDVDHHLAGFADEVTVQTWTTPDVLRSTLVNGDSDVTAVPSYVGANLYNRGVDVHMAAVTVWGLIWLLGPEGTGSDWEALRGETVMIPFPNDMPDLVFRHLAQANGLTPGEDFTIEYYSQPPEIVGRLVSGEGNFAVLPEHVATLALANATQNGQALTRMFDLQREWSTVTRSGARIPQAGIVVSDLVADDPELLGAVLDSLEAAVDAVNAGEASTVTALAEATGVPEAMVASVIPRLNLEVVAASDARSEVEAFFDELVSMSPDILAGALPDEGFYLADPR